MLKIDVLKVTEGNYTATVKKEMRGKYHNLKFASYSSYIFITRKPIEIGVVQSLEVVSEAEALSEQKWWSAGNLKKISVQCVCLMVFVF